jgi:hypothetical protein
VGTEPSRTIRSRPAGVLNTSARAVSLSTRKVDESYIVLEGLLTVQNAKRPPRVSPGTLIVASAPKNQSCSPSPDPNQVAVAIIPLTAWERSSCGSDRIPPVSETSPRWWTVRPAQNRKPATYRCPLCGKHLPALGEHMLIAPEGVPAGRRHAHTLCVITARKAGRLPSRDEWRATQPRSPGFLARLLRRE